MHINYFLVHVHGHVYVVKPKLKFITTKEDEQECHKTNAQTFPIGHLHTLLEWKLCKVYVIYFGLVKLTLNGMLLIKFKHLSLDREVCRERKTRPPAVHVWLAVSYIIRLFFKNKKISTYIYLQLNQKMQTITSTINIPNTDQ